MIVESSVIEEDVPFPQKKDRFWSVMADIGKQWV